MSPGARGNGYQEAERVRALAGRVKALGGNNVTIADTSRNWYADKGINTLSIPDGYAILEAHMDSGAASAKGGHVIIKAGFRQTITITPWQDSWQGSFREERIPSWGEVTSPIRTGRQPEGLITAW